MRKRASEREIERVDKRTQGDGNDEGEADKKFKKNKYKKKSERCGEQRIWKRNS